MSCIRPEYEVDIFFENQKKIDKLRELSHQAKHKRNIKSIISASKVRHVEYYFMSTKTSPC